MIAHISTGTEALDALIGPVSAPDDRRCPGIPRHGITHLRGSDAVKVAVGIASEALATEGAKVVWIDADETYPPVWAGQALHPLAKTKGFGIFRPDHGLEHVVGAVMAYAKKGATLVVVGSIRGQRPSVCDDDATRRQVRDVASAIWDRGLDRAKTAGTAILGLGNGPWCWTQRASLCLDARPGRVEISECAFWPEAKGGSVATACEAEAGIDFDFDLDEVVAGDEEEVLSST